LTIPTRIVILSERSESKDLVSSGRALRVGSDPEA